jgi:hypothetical protein
LGIMVTVPEFPFPSEKKLILYARNKPKRSLRSRR